MKIKILNKYPFVVLLIFLMAAILIRLFGVIINITPSMKEGIYFRKFGEVKSGDIVAACLSDPYKEIGLSNHYIQNSARCGGADPVIKKVIAVPGDNVILMKDYIFVNNVRYPFKTFYVDSKNRKLIVYPRGKYLRTNGYWLVGTDSEKSWDSRYFGPVKKEQILFKLKAFWTT